MKTLVRQWTCSTLAAASCIGLLAAGTHASAAVSSAGTTVCTPRQLESLGQYTRVTNSSTSGRWLTGTSSSGIPIGDPIPVWRNGAVTPLSEPAQLAYAGGVNSRGVLAGYLLPDFGEPQVAFAQDRDSFISLATPAAVETIDSTRGISDAGLVGGTGITASGRSVPIVWSLDRPDQPRVLRIPRDESAEIVDVSGSGLVGMVVGTGTGTRSVLVRPSGKYELFPPTEPGASVAVSAVGNGWAVGEEHSPDGGTHIVRYSLASGEVERLDISSGSPADINADGWVVGNDAEGGFLFTDQLIRLPSTDESNVSGAYTIDDRGRPAGKLESEFFSNPAFWTCSD